MDQLEREGVNLKALNIARLWALTGCRRDEIAGLTWPEVNLEEGFLELDDSKTGKSIRPLGAAAVALLKSIDKKDSSNFVFPAERGGRHFQGTKTVWSRAIEKAKLPGVTPHTLRHTVGSTAISTGEAVALTGAILGHANPRSTAIYAHVQNDPSKRAANRVTRKIAAALTGKPSDEKQSKGRRAAGMSQMPTASLFGYSLSAWPKTVPCGSPARGDQRVRSVRGAPTTGACKRQMIVAILQTSALSEPEFLAIEQSSRMRCSPSPKYGPQLGRPDADTLRRPQSTTPVARPAPAGRKIGTTAETPEGRL